MFYGVILHGRCSVRRIVRENGNSCDGVGHVDDIEYEKIRRAAWKVDVLGCSG